jgi:hypothetical protein
MRLFYWRSTLLQTYGRGWLFAVANDADEARRKIEAHFDTWYNERHSYMIGYKDEKTDRAEKLGYLKADLTPDPTILETMFVEESF